MPANNRSDHDPYGDVDDHDRGLSYDLPALLSRRRMLALIGGAGAFALTACATDSQTSTDSPTSADPAASTGGPPSPSDAASATSDATSATGQIPAETAGPYPGDGSNGANVLTASGVVRSDITRSFGSGSAVAKGVPLTIRLTVLDTRDRSAPLAGAAVYLWQCDIDGKYSLYSPGVTQENYLRGVQETGADGSVTFQSIYPGAYSGRWPHIHFEVYPSLAKATTASGKLRTSQLALPEGPSALVYATAGYAQSVGNLARTSLATDNVFSDGYSLQLATVTGTVTAGMTATLAVPV